MSGDVLFSCLAPRGSSAVCRLICFPWSGGGTSVYARWGRCVPEFLEVIAVRLRGRENRFKEEPYADRRELIEEVAEGIVRRGFFDGARVAFFGHSLGSFIAIETAFYLKKKHNLDLEHLFVSGASAPNSAQFIEYIKNRKYSQMSDDALKTWLVGQGGTPKEVLDNDEFLNLHLSTLKADLNIVEKYSFEHDLSEIKLETPITCFDGDEDYDHDQDTFQTLTSSKEFQKIVLPGGHFYLFHEDNKRKLLATISERLDGISDIV